MAAPYFIADRTKVLWRDQQTVPASANTAKGSRGLRPTQRSAGVRGVLIWRTLAAGPALGLLLNSSQYTKKKEELEKDYTTTLAELEAERMAIEQLLAIEEKRCGASQANTTPGKTAKLIALEALDKVFAA